MFSERPIKARHRTIVPVSSPYRRSFILILQTAFEGSCWRFMINSLQEPSQPMNASPFPPRYPHKIRLRPFLVTIELSHSPTPHQESWPSCSTYRGRNPISLWADNLTIGASVRKRLEKRSKCSRNLDLLATLTGDSIENSAHRITSLSVVSYAQLAESTVPDFRP
jgi:hypothetical protein